MDSSITTGDWFRYQVSIIMAKSYAHYASKTMSMNKKVRSAFVMKQKILGHMLYHPIIFRSLLFDSLSSQMSPATPDFLSCKFFVFSVLKKKLDKAFVSWNLFQFSLVKLCAPLISSSASVQDL
jgi:hypothetical protein